MYPLSHICVFRIAYAAFLFLSAAQAFDSGNLMEVARAVRAADPSRLIIMAADNDHHLPRRAMPVSNVGEVKARAAAQEVGGVVLLPSFTAADPGTDWNDYAAQHGKDAVRKLAQEALQGHGVTLPGISQAQRDTARQQSRSRPHGVDQDQARAGQEAARRAQERGPSTGPQL